MSREVMGRWLLSIMERDFEVSEALFVILSECEFPMVFDD